MTTLELECPNCGELLELDAGFAGGVCRCSSCAMLMSVPAAPPQPPVERLVRPEHPGSLHPGSMVGTLPRKSAAPRAPAGRTVAPTPDKPGKTARIAPQAATPPATPPRRRPTRLLTLVIFGLALLIAVAFCAVAISLALRAENADVAPAPPALDPMSDASAASGLAKARASRYIPLTQGQWMWWNHDADATQTGAGDGS